MFNVHTSTKETKITLSISLATRGCNSSSYLSGKNQTKVILGCTGPLGVTIYNLKDKNIQSPNIDENLKIFAE